MEKFTIEDLKFANEICFNDTFERVLKNNLPEEELEIWQIYHMNFREKGGLLNWIFSIGRDQLQDGWDEIINNIVIDILGKYRQ